MIPILLDTDIGTDVDDAIALALLLASPEFDLRAVTCVSGDVRLRARIAKKLLTVGGRGDIPVAAGVAEPVLRQRRFLWLGHEGQGIVEEDDPLTLAKEHAVDLLIETVLRERPQVIAIGPLSNLAVAIMKEPAIIDAIPALTVMGGAFGVRDDANVPMVDYNLLSDPEAALVVLGAGIPTTLIPLDVTWEVRLRAEELARLRRSKSRVVQIVCDAMEIWWPLHRAVFAGQGAYPHDVAAFLHDPLTVAAVFDRSFLTMRQRRLKAEIRDGLFQLVDAVDGAMFDVAVAVDAAAFVEFLVTRLEQEPAQ